ncbi:MAG: 3-keto-disaccharide hydrolase [Opitutales bacterium]
MSQFEVWIGVPHTSVEGLPKGTFQSDNVRRGTPMGLDADIKDVFSVSQEDGGPVLCITGEIYGGLTTLKTFENYHFSTLVKWGERKWAPRLQLLRDSGILYHCHGDHGRFWKVWKASLEFQVQETDLGDFIGLGGAKGLVRSRKVDGTKRPIYDPESEQYRGGYISAFPEPDKPHGEWNRLDLYVIGDRAIHVVNGEVVMVVEDARKKNGTPLIKGQIQIQSEAAEIYYKDMRIRPIEEFPKALLKRVRWKKPSE